jgi:DNA repair ATPase RecN
MTQRPNNTLKDQWSVMENNDIEKLRGELKTAESELSELEAHRVLGALEAFKKHRAAVSDAQAKVEWLQSLVHDAQQELDAEQRARKLAELARLGASLAPSNVRERLRPIAERIANTFVEAAKHIDEMDAAVRDLNVAHTAAFSILQQLDAKDPSIRDHSSEIYRNTARGLTACLRLLTAPDLVITELQQWFGVDAYNAIQLAGGSHRSGLNTEAQLKAAVEGSDDSVRSLGRADALHILRSEEPLRPDAA